MLCPTQSATVRPERVSSRQSWTIRDREVPNAEPVRIVCLEVSGGLPERLHGRRLPAAFLGLRNEDVGHAVKTSERLPQGTRLSPRPPQPRHAQRRRLVPDRARIQRRSPPDRLPAPHSRSTQGRHARSQPPIKSEAVGCDLDVTPPGQANRAVAQRQRGTASAGSRRARTASPTIPGRRAGAGRRHPGGTAGTDGAGRRHQASVCAGRLPLHRRRQSGLRPRRAWMATGRSCCMYRRKGSASRAWPIRPGSTH